MTTPPKKTAEPIALLPEPIVPDLPGIVVVEETVEELVEQMARDLLTHSLNCVRSFGDFQMALSGGLTPTPFYRHLMIDPACRRIPWRKTHFWLVDEICIPNTPSPPNWAVISEFLTEHADIPRSQQHPIDTSVTNPCADYEAKLQRILEWREKGHDRLDYVLLQINDAGGVAGLLAHNDQQSDRLIARNFPAANLQRPSSNAHPGQSACTLTPKITMTHRLLNAARFVAIMVTGKAKCDIITQVIADHQLTSTNRESSEHRGVGATPDRPILGINPMAGSLRWYLDRSACPANR